MMRDFSRDNPRNSTTDNATIGGACSIDQNDMLEHFRLVSSTIEGREGKGIVSGNGCGTIDDLSALSAPCLRGVEKDPLHSIVTNVLNELDDFISKAQRTPAAIGFLQTKTEPPVDAQGLLTVLQHASKQAGTISRSAFDGTRESLVDATLAQSVQQLSTNLCRDIMRYSNAGKVSHGGLDLIVDRAFEVQAELAKIQRTIAYNSMGEVTLAEQAEQTTEGA